MSVPRSVAAPGSAPLFPDFQVTQTRGSYHTMCGWRGWVIREYCLAAIALGVIALAVVAISHRQIRWMHQLPQKGWIVLLVAACLLGLRTLIFRPIVGAIVGALLYPLKGYEIWPNPKRRELCLAILAIALLTISAIAISPSKARWMELLFAGGWKMGVAAGSLLTIRSLLRAIIWGYSDSLRRHLNAAIASSLQDWSHIPSTTIRTRDGIAIKVRGICQNPKKPWVIVLLGNVALYNQGPPAYWSETVGSGYNLLFYHPPQYGESLGTRNSQTDCSAAEALLQYLITTQEQGGMGSSEDKIHLLAQSIGSGAAIEMMSKYQLGKSILITPFATTNSMARRNLHDIGLEWLHWFAAQAIHDYGEYNNLAKMAQLQTAQVVILQRSDDEIMGRGREGESLREGEELANGWSGGRPPDREDEGYTTYRRGDRRLDLITVPGGHNDPISPRLIHHLLTFPH